MLFMNATVAGVGLLFSWIVIVLAVKGQGSRITFEPFSS